MAVLHDDDLDQVTRELRVMAGSPKLVESVPAGDEDRRGIMKEGLRTTLRELIPHKQA